MAAQVSWLFCLNGSFRAALWSQNRQTRRYLRQIHNRYDREIRNNCQALAIAEISDPPEPSGRRAFSFKQGERNVHGAIIVQASAGVGRAGGVVWRERRGPRPGAFA